MILQTAVGPSTNNDGTFPNARSGRAGEVIVAESNPRYYESTYRGQKFSACNTAAVTIGALSATNVSFALYNPPNSGKNLVLVAASFAASSTVFTTGPIFFAYNVQAATPAGTTALTIKSNLLTGNAAASVAQAFSTATLSGTPVAVRPFLGVLASTSLNSYDKDDIAGELIVAPGGALSIQGNVAATAIGFIGISWDEVAI